MHRHPAIALRKLMLALLVTELLSIILTGGVFQQYQTLNLLYQYNGNGDLYAQHNP